MRKIYLLLTVLVLLGTIALTACGRNSNNEDPAITNLGNGASGITGTGGGDMPPIEVLTIATHISQEGRFRQAAVALQETMALQGRDVEVVFNTFMDGERATIEDLLLSQFAAGLGPDIFARDWSILLAPFIQEGFIQDIYPLIDRSPTSSRDDFFMNVLEGFEDSGRLYVMPTDFSMDFIGINANVPQAFINRFAALDRVRPSDIIEIYNDLIEAHPEFAEMAMVLGLSPYQVIAPEFRRAISVSDGVVDFSEFGNLMDAFRDGFYGNDRFGTFPPFNAQPEDMDFATEHYVFFRTFGGHGNAEALLEYNPPWFIYYTPFVDESGRIVNRTPDNIPNVAISATANDPDLAWAFVEHLISTEATGFRFGNTMSIRREYFEETITGGFQNMVAQRENRPFMFGEFTAIDNAVRRLARYAEMEFTSVPANYAWDSNLMFPALSSFFAGEISSDEAVDMLYTAFTDWINEERAIEPYVPTVVEPLPDLPARVLTVHGSGEFSAVIEQAAAAMNASWRVRNEPYIFQVIIDDFLVTDWDGAMGRAERLSMEFMAGGGPDIFFVEDMHTIFDYATAGFLVDLYTLMDNSPHTSRNDYLVELLRAFEIGGELYTLPLSVGFMYASISSLMPQHFIDRFAQKSSISLMEIAEMYLELMENYGDQFGHLLPGIEGTPTMPYNFLVAHMGEFIDLNNNTVNFNSPEFINLLELTRTLLEITTPNSEWGLMGHGWVTSPTQNTQFLRDRQNDVMFITTGFNFNPLAVFFESEEEIFINPIPLTNSQGELLIDTGWSSGVWGEIAVTSAGNPELAWEFIQYILDVFVEPVGRARINPGWGNPAAWLESIATPVHHPHTTNFVRNIIEEFITRPGVSQFTDFIHLDNPDERERELNAALERIARYNSMPMATMTHHLPHNMLMHDTVFEFFEGFITAQAAAQRMQNTVQLWLDEA